MASVVVTGATGLVGRAAVARLSKSHRVICVGRDRAQAPNAEAIAADLADKEFAKRLPSRADAVVHLAQSGSYAEFPAGVEDVFAVNVAGVAALLSWAQGAGVRRFIHTSTGGLYGRGSRPFKEEDPLDLGGSLGFYFRTKRCAELLAEGYRQCFSVLTLRPFFIYGRGQRQSMLIPRLIESVASGRPVSLKGRDGIRLNPIHVEDVAAVIERCLLLDIGGTFNLAGSEVVSIRGLTTIIGEYLGRAPTFSTVGSDTGQDIIGDISRMSQVFSAPKVRLAQGIAQLCAVLPRSEPQHL